MFFKPFIPGSDKGGRSFITFGVCEILIIDEIKEDGMGGAYGKCWTNETAYEGLVRKPKEKDHLKEVDVDVRII